MSRAILVGQRRPRRAAIGACLPRRGRRPSPYLGVIAACVFAGLALAAPSRPQLDRTPHIGYVYPAGGQRGTTMEATVGGEYILGATAGLVSGSGVTVRITDAGEPKDNKDGSGKKKKRNQTVLDEVVKLSIAIAPQAAPGDREVRLVTAEGLSNPLVFQVGQLLEIKEREPNDKPGKANLLPTLPVTVNGQIMPGDVDVFEFGARKGQRLVAEVAARALIPYLADAVPGWFQATLSLADERGRELAYDDDYKFNPDPVLICTIPSNGTYRLAIRDSISRGREDFVYRLRVGELPFITSVFPLGARRSDTPAAVSLAGWNLPFDTMGLIVTQAAPCILPVSVTRDGLTAPSVPFAIGEEPEALADEVAARSGQGQPVSLPVVVNGRIRTPGERHTFSFSGKTGQVVRMEVRARRLGSPLDSHLLLADSHGVRLGENDDAKDKSQGLITHQADSELTVTLPEDGTYAVTLYDTQGKGGDDYAYRLRLGAPVPDFDLRAVPSSLSLSKGGTTVFSVQAIRRDGFKGAIRLSLDETSAAGLTLAGGLIPEKADKVNMTLSASSRSRTATPLHPQLTGTATVAGNPVSRPVIPAEDLMQAFIYRHLVPARDWVVMVRDPPAPFTVAVELPSSGVLDLPVGREVEFPLTATRRPGFDGPLRFELVDPPKGITLRRGFIQPGKIGGFITIRTESKVELGLRDNLILTAAMPLDAESPASSVSSNAPAIKAATNAPVATAALPVRATTNAVGSAGTVGSGKRPFRERVVVTLPAVPFQTVDRPERKNTDAGKTPKKK